MHVAIPKTSRKFISGVKFCSKSQLNLDEKDIESSDEANCGSIIEDTGLKVFNSIIYFWKRTKKNTKAIKT
jgi:hypothetical protein